MISNNHLDILAGRGLDAELADRLNLSTVVRGGGDALAIPFYRNGQMVRRKFRFFDREEGKWTAEKGGVRCAYNEDCLRDNELLGMPLIITEGEFDALAAIQSGFVRTISVPDGAPPPGERTAEELEASAKYAWIGEIKDLLSKERVPEIIIAADGDTNGAALLQDLSIQLGRARCKYLTYPKCKADRGRERCKDLNEVLEDYGVAGVRATIKKARWIKIEGVYKMGDLPPLPAMQIFEPRHEMFREHFKLRLGDFSVFTGTPGFGKTSFVNDLLCGIATDHDLPIAWASFEQEPQRDHRRSLRTWFHGHPEHTQDERQRAAADAWIDRVHLFIIPGEDDDASLDWLLEKMELAVVRHGAKIVVIDPWNELEHNRRGGETETEYIGRAIRLLKRFAKSFQVHVVVIAHPVKSVKDADGNYKMPTLYDIAGSANFYNKADLGVIIHRQDEDNTIIKVQKSRYHDTIGRPGEVIMHFSKDSRQFIEQGRSLI